MEKIKGFFKMLWEKFKALGRGLRIAIIVALVSVLIALISVFIYSNKNKYQVLFNGLDPVDSQFVTNKLKEDKVDVKIDGDSILVPKEQVDELRLALAPELSSGSKGYELMDGGSSFGMTEDEFNIKKVRMLQGELEKTIKSFPQVDNARVHISPAKDSVFVEDKEPGKAAVYLKLVPGNKLKVEQVQSIIALVSGSLDNIPKENVEVIDENMNLLTKDINNKDSNVISSDKIQEQRMLEEEYEQTLQKSIVTLLEPVLGRNKINATVNVDMDFDSKKKTETKIDPNKVIVSQESIRDMNNNGGESDSQSPVDNNMSNTIDEEGNGNSSLREEERTNYESGKEQIETISAPGEVKRLTASVVIDGNLERNLQEAIQNIVATAIGFDNVRGDEINVLGMAFDPAMKEEAEKEAGIFAEMEKAARNKKILIAIVGVVLLLVLAIILGVFLKKRKNKKDLEGEDKQLLDVVIDDKISTRPTERISLDFGENSQKAMFEDEIKKYASNKPDQVVDIVKSWMAEDER